MTSINDSLSQDLIFNTFKRLDCIETTRIRRVCKQWLELIDEHQSFWITLHLPYDSLKKWDQSVLELFDQKSGSNLQNVEVETELREPFLTEFLPILQKSKESLRHLHFTSNHVYYVNGLNILSLFTKVECLRILSPNRTYKVHLQRKSVKSDSEDVGPNAASPLKILWYGPDRSILAINSSKFENLVSLDSGATLTASEWRGFLEGPSRSLKHLRLGFKDGKDEDHSGVLTLDFPNLEVLELDSGGDFPRWLLIPDTVKLIAHARHSNLPSISELWSWDSTDHEKDIINRLPKLRTLCLAYARDPRNVIEILNERKVNVEAGLQVDGVKMERIKTLVLPFRLTDPGFSEHLKQRLERCRELVEVVEGNAQSRFIEVEY